MEEYKLPNLETQPTYLVSFDKTVKESLKVIEEKRNRVKSENEVTVEDVLQMAENSGVMEDVRKVKKDTDALQETIDNVNEYLQKKQQFLTSTDGKENEVFFKGYRPNFYFRSDVE